MTREQEFLLNNNGKTVKIGGLQYSVKTTANKAIYPYKHTSIRTELEPTRRNTTHYLETKSVLKDDWMISYDSSDVDLQVSVLSQLGYNFQ